MTMQPSRQTGRHLWLNASVNDTSLSWGRVSGILSGCICRCKLRIFLSNVKSVLLYGSETWKVAKTTTSKLQVFVNRCLRRILNIYWPEVISNEELWRRAEETEISIQIKRRKWNWMGHTLKKGHDIIEREVLDWNPQRQRKRGRPKQTWRRSVHNEALGEGKSWGEVKQLARNQMATFCWRPMSLKG